MRRLSGRRAARQEEGAFVVDGPTLLGEALSSGVVLSDVIATPDAPHDLLTRAEAAGARVHAVTAEVLSGAVDTVTPHAVAAIARRAVSGTEQAVAAAAGSGALVLVDLNDPGNAGTLLRAAESSGMAAVLFAGDSVDPWNPKCVRASAGALFRLTISVGGGARDLIDRFGAAGVTTVATTVRGGTPYHELDLTGPVAFVLGSEAHGLAAEVVEAADRCASIPMSGASESLNVAMAGTVLCFEALRQRGTT